LVPDVAGTKPSEVEEEDLEGSDGGSGGAGPSSTKRKRKAGSGEEEDAFGEIVAGLSGDEVDTGNIIDGGRGARRGRYTGSGAASAKYTAKAEVASDEDSW
jgi:hypothetical protein